MPELNRYIVFYIICISFFDAAPEDVLPACQLTLKTLQLDYLDLYLIHTPIHVRKGAPFPFSEEDKRDYDADSMSQTWKVSI